MKNFKIILNTYHICRQFGFLRQPRWWGVLQKDRGIHNVNLERGAGAPAVEIHRDRTVGGRVRETTEPVGAYHSNDIPPKLGTYM